MESSTIKLAGVAGVEVPAIVFFLFYNQKIAKEFHCEDAAQGSQLWRRLMYDSLVLYGIQCTDLNFYIASMLGET